MWYEYIILLIGILVLFNFLEVVFLIFSCHLHGDFITTLRMDLHSVLFFCRSNLITFLILTLTDSQTPSLLYNTNLQLTASQNMANVIANRDNVIPLSTCQFTVIFPRYHILSDGVLINVINCSGIDNGRRNHRRL